jgi:hypothetical protein
MSSDKIIALAAAFMLSASTAVFAQSSPTGAKADDNNASGSVTQPQGKTGPIVTKSGGAPASSPQGESPAGMQAAPRGSSDAIKTDKDGVPEGTPKN